MGGDVSKALALDHLDGGRVVDDLRMKLRNERLDTPKPPEVLLQQRTLSPLDVHLDQVRIGARGQLAQERVHADHRDDASARTNVSAVGVLMVVELCRSILRADSRLYHLGLDVVSFQVEPRDPRVFGRRLHRYHRRAAVAVREPQTGETDVRAEIDEPSGPQLEGQSVTLVHPHLPDRLHIPAVQAIVQLDASAYADPALAVAARKRHQSGQAQKEHVCGKPCERSRVRGQRKTAAQLTPDSLRSASFASRPQTTSNAFSFENRLLSPPSACRIDEAPDMETQASRIRDLIFQPIIYVFQNFVLKYNHSVFRFPPLPTCKVRGVERQDLNFDSRTEKLATKNPAHAASRKDLSRNYER